jgi:hypothetical protein
MDLIVKCIRIKPLSHVFPTQKGPKKSLPPSKTAQAVTLLTFIWEVPGSNIG